MSAKSALDKFSRRNMGIKKPRQKNGKRKSPEKETEKDVLNWCKKHRFDVSVVESKAVFSRAAQRYLHGQTEAGFSDIAGCTDTGKGCFIELKAKGKLNTIRPAQIEFLVRKIRCGAFACCVDSADMLNDIYHSWIELDLKDSKMAKNYLLSKIPKFTFGGPDSEDFTENYGIWW